VRLVTVKILFLILAAITAVAATEAYFEHQDRERNEARKQYGQDVKKFADQGEYRYK
jgi:hypothetical protein